MSNREHKLCIFEVKCSQPADETSHVVLFVFTRELTEA